jgi:YggT family protein
MNIISGNLLLTIAMIVNWVIQIYIFIIIARALISWVEPNPYNPIVQLLYKITEPVLRPIRRILPLRGMGFDISPLIAIIILWASQYFIVRTLQDMAFRFKM